jgi:hypothetical protein
MKKSLYDITNTRLTRLKNTGFDYEGNLFKRSLSPYILLDNKRSSILLEMEKMIFFLIEKAKYIKTFVNYTVPADYRNLN